MVNIFHIIFLIILPMFISIGVPSYLLGSIPFSLILPKIFNGDVRKSGSTNEVAIATLLINAGKGALPIFIFIGIPTFNQNINSPIFGQFPPNTLFILSSILAFFAVLGHCFPTMAKIQGRQRRGYGTWGVACCCSVCGVGGVCGVDTHSKDYKDIFPLRTCCAWHCANCYVFCLRQCPRKYLRHDYFVGMDEASRQYQTPDEGRRAKDQ